VLLTQDSGVLKVLRKRPGAFPARVAELLTKLAPTPSPFHELCEKGASARLDVRFWASKNV
jgi:hypothetical protein